MKVKEIWTKTKDWLHTKPILANTHGKTFGDFFFHLLTSFKSILAFCLILLSLVYASSIILKIARTNKLQITRLPEGTIVYSLGDNENNTLLLFSLPASAPWASTGFKLKGGETIVIQASGNVNLGLAQLVDTLRIGVRNGHRPSHPWVDPDGMTEMQKTKLTEDQIWLHDYLFKPDRWYGALLAGISNTNNPPMKGVDSIWYVGKYWEGEVPENGTLWFTTNDILFSPESKAISIRAREIHKEGISNMVDSILSHQYWNAWFDDNIGSFLITVKKD